MIDWFSDRLNQAKSDATVDFIFHALPEAGQHVIHPDKSYIRISVEAMRIVSRREWNLKYHGAVHVDLKYLREQNEDVEFQTVIAPDRFRSIDAKNSDRVIVQNMPVLGPVPYQGELEFNVGLFSVVGSDLAAPYLDLLSTLTEKVGGAVGQAKALVEPLRAGMSKLFGDVGSSELEVGLVTNWTEAKTGRYVLIAAPLSKIDPSKLSYDSSARQIKCDDGVHLTEYSYLVLNVEAPETRPDWYKIPALSQAWKAVEEADKNGTSDEVKARLKAFEKEAFWSPDLIRSHARKLSLELQELTKGMFPEPEVDAKEDAMGGRLSSTKNGPAPRQLGKLQDLRPFS